MNFILLQDDKWSYNFDPKLQKLVTQLESGLHSVLQKGDQSVHHETDFSKNIAGEFVFFGMFVCIFVCVGVCVCSIQFSA
jgi:hypothetical protein